MPTTFYLDPENGNDANDGSSWANAWKTWTLGATAARITAGDTIRIAKSPDEVNSGVNATFTYGSIDVTLASALTLDISNCDSDWTASANVTRTTSTNSSYYTEGSACQKFAIASGFTTGLVAYKAMSATDFSDYENISFIIFSSADVAAGVFQICLCSDNAGATPVDSLTIDVPIGYDSAPYSYKTVLTLKKGSALGSSIQSVALYALSDPGTVDIYLDNIIACNDFSLNSLVGKTGDTVYPIMNITGGTAIKIGTVGSTEGSDLYYRGSSETTTFYFRNGFRASTIAVAYNTVVEGVTEAGTYGNQITFSGGWNTSTTEQDGMTYYDGLNGLGYGISFGGFSYISIENLGAIRFYVGIYCYKNGSMLGISLKNIDSIASALYGMRIEDASEDQFCGVTVSGTCRILGSGTIGFYVVKVNYLTSTANITVYGYSGGTNRSEIQFNTCKDIYLMGDNTVGGYGNSSTAYACLGILTSRNVYVKKLISEKSSNSGLVRVSGSSYVTIDHILLNNNTADDLFTYTTSNNIRVGKLDQNSKTITGDIVSFLSSSIYDGVSFDYLSASNRWKTVRKYGEITDQVTGGQAEAWAYGGSGTCMYFNPNSQVFALPFKTYAPVTASTTYKLQMKVKKTSDAATCTMKIRRISGCGATPIFNESVTLTDSWATFESSSFTPTFSGYMEIEIWAFDGSTTGDIGVDNLTLVTV
jgi:hypothetical protein